MGALYPEDSEDDVCASDIELVVWKVAIVL